MSEYPQSNPASYRLAQRLNNRAAICIETGKFDSAIQNLTKAMQISREGNTTPACTCKTCTLQACMAFSKQNVRGASREQTSQDSAEDVGFIHRQPLTISPQSMNHPMGSIFPLLVTFNLALAHHLSALQENEEESRQRKLQKSLKLYELAYRWQMEEEVNSLAFTMIIANNLGEIHRVSKNQKKHEKCLQNLLSTMMYVIALDYNDEVVEMDGFFKNTSPLFLQETCAGAA